MSDPASWQKVEDNAERQLTKAKKIAKGPPVDIGAFYPELYKPFDPPFSNTVGSHLIADILTSPCVLVDLYDWPQPSDLIKTYGVDLPFLLKLREKGHVVICANLLPERYTEATWLHEVLADERTIFRSVRTPQFFEARRKDFQEDQREFAKEIKTHLDGRPASDVTKLAMLANPTHPLDDAQQVADVFSYWGKRLSVMNPSMEPTVAQLATHPENVIREVRQRQLIDVSPFTAGLGSYFRRDVKKLSTDFPDRLDMGILPEKTRASIQGLNEYLTRLTARISHTDLTSEQIWNEMSGTKRDEIHELLEDKEGRTKARKAEETLRKTLLRAGHEEWSEQQIKEYVNEEIQYWEKINQIGQFGMMVTGTVAFLSGVADADYYLALAGFGTGILGSKITQPVIEKLVPKLQLVNFVKEYRDGK